MSIDQHGTPKLPPWFPLALVAVGGALLLGAGLWPRLDVPLALEHRLNRAGAAIAPDAAAWLRDANVAGQLLAGGAAIIALGLAAQLLRSHLLARDQRVSISPRVSIRRPIGRLNSPWAVPAAAALAAVVRFLPTLRDGYFRYDDFELVAEAQTGGWAAMAWLHGDHFMPLTRLLFHLGPSLFGVNPLGWNVALLLAFGAMVGTACRLLHELGASRAAQVVFAALLIGWSPWAEIMAGYYVLGTYVLIALCGLIANWRYLIWRRSGRDREIVVVAVCALIAALVDLSGWYVIGTCGLFLLRDQVASEPAARGSDWWRANRRIIGWLAVTALVGLGLTWWEYAVRHPGAFLGMARSSPHSLLQVAGDLGYLFSAGVLTSLFVPFVYARLPAALLLPLAALALVIWLVFFVGSLRRAPESRRWILLTMLGIILGTGLMVVLGRPPDSGGPVRWAAKHLCPIYLWFCLLVAAGWDVHWQRFDRVRRFGLIEATMALGFLFLCAQYTGGLLGRMVASAPFGYPAELRDARIRRADVAALQHNVVEALATANGVPAIIPTLDGPMIQVRHPSLFTYNLSHYLPFVGPSAAGIDLVRNAAMQPWRTAAVRTVPSLRSAVSPSTRRQLAEDPGLRRLYFAGVELSGRPLDPAAAGATVMTFAPATTEAEPTRDAGVEVVPGARVEIVLVTGAWDPEERHRLRIALAAGGPAAKPVKLGLSVWSDLLNDRWSGSLVVPPEGVEVDLLQVCAFSLSERVGALRLSFTTPGHYRFARLELVP